MRVQRVKKPKISKSIPNIHDDNYRKFKEVVAPSCRGESGISMIGIVDGVVTG